MTSYVTGFFGPPDSCRKPSAAGQAIHGSIVKFFPRPYFWFSSWSTNGRRHNARWLVGEHTARGHNSDWVSIDWYADTCWRTIYTHDSTGYPEFGTVQELIEQVLIGIKTKTCAG